MRFTTTTAALLATLASANPTNLRNQLARRSATESCSVGYCTQNGGTTGGAAGSTVTVTDVDSLKEYAESSDAYTIIVSGSLTGAEKIKVKDNKTIYGESGSCKSILYPFPPPLRQQTRIHMCPCVYNIRGDQADECIQP